MPIAQSIDSALERNVGRHGLAADALAGALARAEGALDPAAEDATSGG